MVVCRYFLQGSCKFGSSCFNEHPSGGNEGYSVTAQRQLFGGGRGGGPKVTFKDSFGGNHGNQSNNNPFKWVAPDAKQKQSQATQQTSASDIIKTMSNETDTWSKSGMWPISCVGYDKDAASIPGFEDVHPDELRHEAYEALKLGNIQPYVQKVEGLMNEVNSKRAELKNPSMTFKQKLISFIEDCRRKSTGSSATSGSLFGGASGVASTGLFGQGGTTAGASSASTGLFGQGGSSGGATSASTGLFGGSTGFGQQTFSQPSQTPSLFGQSDPSAGQQGLFGAAPFVASSVQPQLPFGAATGPTYTQQTSEPQTIFGKPVQATQPAAQGLFGQTTGPAAFGQAQTAPVASLFGKPMHTPAFPVTPTTPQSFFGSPSATGSSQGLFGNTNPSAAAVSSGAAAFANPVVPSGSTAGIPPTAQPSGAQDNKSSVYTPMDTLTPAELEQFNAPTFTLGQIPTRPPARELCF